MVARKKNHLHNNIDFYYMQLGSLLNNAYPMMWPPNYMKSQLTRQLTTNLLLLKEFYYALLTSLKNEKRWLGLDLGAFAFPELCVQISHRLMKALKALKCRTKRSSSSPRSKDCLDRKVHWHLIFWAKVSICHKKVFRPNRRNRKPGKGRFKWMRKRKNL